MPNDEQSGAEERPPAPNMNEDELFAAIVADYEGAWESMAANARPIGGGNFMFGRQAMTLLEFGCRLAAEDPRDAALRDLSTILVALEPKYFNRSARPFGHLQDPA